VTAVESLYSMDGTVCAQLEAPDWNQTMLFIDEAHATSVFGLDGRGLSSALEGADNVVTVAMDRPRPRQSRWK
jgi:8-amino-7-oxononanoate synthase